jgi:hypothetical protein
MLPKLDRIGQVVLHALVGLTAIIPGWTMATAGTVGGFTLPTEWLSSYAPFRNYLVPGLILLFIIGVGNVIAAVINLVDPEVGAIASLAAGVIVVGDHGRAGLHDVLTWVVLACGVAMVALALPRVMPTLTSHFGPGGRRGTV